MDATAYELLRTKHGKLHADQQRWQHWLTAAFDAVRTPGARYQLFTVFKAARWQEFQRVTKDDKQAKEFFDAGLAIVEVWKDEGYGKGAEDWYGAAGVIERTADQAACMAIIGAFFDAKEWTLRE